MIYLILVYFRNYHFTSYDLDITNWKSFEVLNASIGGSLDTAQKESDFGNSSSYDFNAAAVLPLNEDESLNDSIELNNMEGLEQESLSRTSNGNVIKEVQALDLLRSETPSICEFMEWLQNTDFTENTAWNPNQVQPVISEFGDQNRIHELTGFPKEQPGTFISDFLGPITCYPECTSIPDDPQLQAPNLIGPITCYPECTSIPDDLQLQVPNSVGPITGYPQCTSIPDDLQLQVPNSVGPITGYPQCTSIPDDLQLQVPNLVGPITGYPQFTSIPDDPRVQDPDSVGPITCYPQCTSIPEDPQLQVPDLMRTIIGYQPNFSKTTAQSAEMLTESHLSTPGEFGYQNEPSIYGRQGELQFMHHKEPFPHDESTIYYESIMTPLNDNLANNEELVKSFENTDSQTSLNITGSFLLSKPDYGKDTPIGDLSVVSLVGTEPTGIYTKPAEMFHVQYFDQNAGIVNRSDFLSNAPDCDTNIGGHIHSLPDTNMGGHIHSLSDTNIGDHSHNLPDTHMGGHIHSIPDTNIGGHIHSLPDTNMGDHSHSLPDSNMGDHSHSLPDSSERKDTINYEFFHKDQKMHSNFLYDHERESLNKFHKMNSTRIQAAETLQPPAQSMNGHLDLSVLLSSSKNHSQPNKNFSLEPMALESSNLGYNASTSFDTSSQSTSTLNFHKTINKKGRLPKKLSVKENCTKTTSHSPQRKTINKKGRLPSKLSMKENCTKTTSRAFKRPVENTETKSRIQKPPTQESNPSLISIPNFI